MPTIRWFPPKGPPRAFAVYKPVTTLGKALGNDVAIDGGGVAEHHAQIVFDGRDFNLEEIDRQGEILINGKKKRRARLVHGDRLTLGESELAFSIFAESTGPNIREARDGDTDDSDPTHRDFGEGLGGVRKLHDFSERLMVHAKGEIDTLICHIADYAGQRVLHRAAE